MAIKSITQMKIPYDYPAQEIKEHGPSYLILQEMKSMSFSIKCGKCQKESWSMGDVNNRYCANCHIHHIRSFDSPRYDAENTFNDHVQARSALIPLPPTPKTRFDLLEFENDKQKNTD